MVFTGDSVWWGSAKVDNLRDAAGAERNYYSNGKAMLANLASIVTALVARAVAGRIAEPSTLAAIGFGLILVGSFARHRRAKVLDESPRAEDSIVSANPD